MIKSNHIPFKWVTHKLEDNNTKKFSDCLECSELHVRLPRLGIQQRTKKPWGMPVGFDYRTNRTGEAVTPDLEGTNSILYVTRPRGKGQ